MRQAQAAVGVVGALIALVSGYAIFGRATPAAPGKLVAIDKEVTVVGGLDPSSPSWRDGSLRIINSGGRPIRITGIQSGGGCTEPKAEPTVLQPGQLGSIRVHASPPAVGETRVRIAIFTDSVATPEVETYVRLKGSRPPPFLLSATGDLGFVGQHGSGESREIDVLTVEPIGASGSPIVRCKLQFLDVKQVAENVKANADPDTVLRTRTYRLTFNSTPPDANFSGVVEVVDPWDQRRVERVPVFGESRPILRAIPPRVALVVGREPQAGERFAILVGSGSGELRVEPEDRSRSILDVTADSPAGTDVVRRFVVRLKSPSSPEHGTYHIKASLTGEQTADILFPVEVVRAGGSK